MKMGGSSKPNAWNVDVPAVMSVLARAAEVRSADDLLDLIKSEVNQLLRHEATICGYHVMTAGGSYVNHFLQYNYPTGYVAAMSASEGRVNSPLMERWRATREPVYFQSGRDDDAYPADWVEVFNQYGLRNTVGHGALDERGSFGSYFIFSCLPGDIGEREVFLLKLITPHLHFALMRTVELIQEVDKPAESGHAGLSERQQEILRLIYQGKTNREIAGLLTMTEKNVNYHIEKIFTKLGVRSRAQAASKAILLGL